MKKVQYIGCLDIAGFEIFDYNGFEQICINFVNEKLQQFFNQHMFTLEQEEYVREGIEWANVDFGMDLQVCITMFEKPMGLLAIWEEESLFPRAPDKNAHFGVSHYAAMVSYNLTGWLEKNKDPLNDTVVELMKNGSNKLLVECFLDHPGQPLEAKKDAGGGGKKKGGGKTVTSFFKAQLDDLMKVLYSTDPSFIRCVVPNTHKQPGGVQPDLIMHQYQCNGVLAGIAICRLGFPNKMLYPDFKARYNILAAGAVAKAKNDKSAAGAVMDVIKLDKEKFRLGHTKVFFRAGILGFMEEVREDKIGSVLALLQAQARGKASRITFKKMQDQKLALYCLQRTIRNFRIGKTWLWWQLWLAIKPNLKCTKFAQYKAEYEEKIAIAEAHIGKALEDREKVTAVHNTLLAQKNELVLALQSGGSAVQEIIDKTNRVEAMAADVQKQLDEVNNRIKGEKQQMDSIGQQVSKINAISLTNRYVDGNFSSSLIMTTEDVTVETGDGSMQTIPQYSFVTGMCDVGDGETEMSAVSLGVGVKRKIKRKVTKYDAKAGRLVEPYVDSFKRVGNTKESYVDSYTQREVIRKIRKSTGLMQLRFRRVADHVTCGDHTRKHTVARFYDLLEERLRNNNLVQHISAEQMELL